MQERTHDDGERVVCEARGEAGVAGAIRGHHRARVDRQSSLAVVLVEMSLIVLGREDLQATDQVREGNKVCSVRNLMVKPGKKCFANCWRLAWGSGQKMPIADHVLAMWRRAPFTREAYTSGAPQPFASGRIPVPRRCTNSTNVAAVSSSVHMGYET